MFALWKIIIIAVVQGIGEFLPISSSGHIVLFAALLQENAKELDVADLSIALHLGTLGSILVYYHRKIWSLLQEDRRVLFMLMLATIPTVIVALPIKLMFKWILVSPLVTGIFLPVTGIVLLWSSSRQAGNVDYRDITWKQALAIGWAQAAAIMPGLSRSGSTISAGMAVGLKRESAATFSFLQAIIAIAGAGVLEVIDIAKDVKHGVYHPSATPLDMLIGAAVAFVIGIGALWLLVRLLERGRMQLFAYYCILLGIAVLAWQVSKIGPAPANQTPSPTALVEPVR